jgi:sRNA-binding protein
MAGRGDPAAPAETPQRHRATAVPAKLHVVSPPPNVGTDMSAETYRIERDRGIKEYRQQLAELRKKWPLAFPVHDKDVRPLAVDAAHEIAVVMGWSYPYTLGVLSRWKMAPLYCQAVLNHPQRITLDGSPAEMVEAKAKDLATKHLARRAASTTARKAAMGAAPTAMKPKPASAPPPASPPETPKQLRDRVRASLLRRRV